MFKLLTISLAGVRSLTISFLLLLLLLFVWLVGFFFFLAFLWIKTNSRFIKTQETKKLDQKSLVNGICYMVKIGFSAPIAKHKAGFSLCRSPTFGSR